MRIVKQKMAMVMGLALVTIHIVMTFYFWFEFGDNDAIFVEKMATPISASFAIAIVKWFVDNQGIIREEQYVYVGLPYLLLIGIVVGALNLVYIGGAVFYEFDDSMSAHDLNQLYFFSETALGGMFAIIFSDLYGDQIEA